MIGWEGVYKVVAAIVPLYVALIMGYGSVRWWRIFTPEQCDAINRLVFYFTFPLFTFELTAHVNPLEMNYRFVAADGLSKVVIVAVLAFWAKCSSKGSFCWSITSFSLSTLTNSLVIGVPLIRAMYGQEGVDLVVQGAVVQGMVWLTSLLFVLEFRRNATGFYAQTTTGVGDSRDVSTVDQGRDVEGNNGVDVVGSVRPSFWSLMKIVWLKMAANPNSYGAILGITWAFLSDRFNFQMPSVLEGSVLIMSKAGRGTAMFSMGLFMAQKEKIIACGPTLTVFGMGLKFIAGPATMAIGAIAVGLRGDVLRVAIIQAAVPQSITSFIFAKEYGLHTDVLSTAVIFGMMVSLPLLTAYYAVLEFLH
ncbi:hypothetical protein NMG60_11032208 [Bertholletia excelsa]